MLYFELLDTGQIDWKMLDSFPDRTIQQTQAWMEFLASTQKAKPVIAALKQYDEVKGYFNGLIVNKFGLRVLGSPLRGWTTDYMGLNLLSGISRQRAFVALEEFAFKQLHCAHFEIMDKSITVEQAQDLQWQYTPSRTYMVDLQPSEEDMLRKMNENARRYIRKVSRDKSVIIEEASGIDFADDYYSQLKDVFAKQGMIPKYGVDRVRALIRHLEPTGRLLLLRARDKSGNCIATGIFPAMGETMYFWGGASWREHQSLHPNEMIHWYAMRYWKERGAIWYDMGGGGEYKKKYGGELVTRPWIRKSRCRAFSMMRDLAWKSFRASLSLRGFLSDKLTAGVRGAGAIEISGQLLSEIQHVC